MVSTNTLCKKILNVKHCVVTNENFYDDVNGIKHLLLSVRPTKPHENDCPYCHQSCPRYDHLSDKPRRWRGLDWNGIVVELEYKTHRIECPIHGVVIADVPWAYPGSRFTKDFDLTVGWLATYLPRSTVSTYMRIDWATVGRCITRTLADIEPERSRRLNGLVNIGIDETSYKKGHKYITVVVNHDNNTVVWAAQGHGKTVLESFFEELSEKQRASIKVVTADGAKWITQCVEKYLPQCHRCVDPFHVVEWATQALDTVRREEWRNAYNEVLKITSENSRRKGRPRKDDKNARTLQIAKEKAEKIKNSTYALGKAPENLTDKQEEKIELIAATSKRLFRAYRLKESLRLLLKIKDANLAEKELDRWLWWASHSRIKAFHELYEKIKRHKKHILNTIEQGMSNARIEATNNKIKLITRKAYGFRNMQNMLDMVYLVCSDLSIPLPNRNLRRALSA